MSWSKSPNPRDTYYRILGDGFAQQPTTAFNRVEAGIALLGGFCLCLGSLAATYAPIFPTADETLSLFVFSKSKTALPRSHFLRTALPFLWSRAPSAQLAWHPLAARGVAGAPTAGLVRSVARSETNAESLMSRGLRAETWQPGDRPQVENGTTFVSNVLQDEGMVVFSRSTKEASKGTLAILGAVRADMKVYDLDLMGEPTNGPVQIALFDFSGMYRVPQVYINGAFVGESEKITEMQRNGTLKETLVQAGVTFES